MNSMLTALMLVMPLVGAADASAATGPDQYRTNKMDPRVRRVPAEIQRGVFEDQERFLKPLVRFLTVGAKDDFHKVKILHDWLADNIAYDVESFFSGADVDSSPASTLKRRKGVCYGYAGLMVQMCELAGIPCERISGYGRGYGFAVGRTENIGDTNHAWNAVRIGGRWYLVDVTWDAGHVGKRAYKKEYYTTYLFMKPRQFVFSHLPSDNKWQLLSSPISAEQFADLPYLRRPFFDHGMSLATRLRRVNRVGESVQFSVVTPDRIDLMVKLRTPDGTAVPRRTFVQRSGDRCKVLATFPRAGRWNVQLFSRPRGETGSMLLAASLQFEATSGTAKSFPMTFGAYDNMDGYLFSPLLVPLRTDKPLLFKVRVRGAHKVSLTIGEKRWLRLSPSPEEKDVYSLKMSVPAGTRVRLHAKRTPEGRSHATLIDFTPKGA